LKKVFFFSGLDKFDIFYYKQLFFWNKDFQNEVYLAEKSIGLGSFIQKALKDSNLDSFYRDIEISLLIFNIAQVSLAKSVERKIGNPDMLFTHSVGEISAGVYNKSVSYRFLWDFYKITMQYCRQNSNLNNNNLFVFGEASDINRFVQANDLYVMSVNSPTSALIWLGERLDIDKKLIKSYKLSSMIVKLLSYPIHTSLMVGATKMALNDLHQSNIFKNNKSNVVQSKFSILSSTKYKVIEPSECKTLEDISEIWTELCRTPMNMVRTYNMLSDFYSAESHINYVLEHSNVFISAIRETDQKGIHYSGLITSTENKFNFLGFNIVVQDLGLYSKIGDSLSFIKK
jgi:hypothetical protein